MIDRPGAAPKEPFFNAPALVFLIPVLLIALYGLQTLLGPQGEAALLDSFALTPVLLRQGNYDLLITHLFLHGSWLHVLANSAFCFAFSAPVVRACGPGILGGLSFLAFYLLCGVAAGLGYCLLNLHSPIPVAGASGAVSGLMAASIRLAGDPYDPPGIKPLTHPTVLSMSLFVCGGNALIPLIGGIFLSDGMVIAWQAHIAGYIFGLLAIAPWMHLFHRRYFTTK